MDRTEPEAPEGGAERRADDAVDERAPDDTSPTGPGDDGDASDGADDLVVIVTVTRTGGIAGLRRMWRAEAGADDASPWITLIEGCPWDALRFERFAAGADRFMWSVDARCGPQERQAELADSAVQGPWRELIDAVRDAGSPVPPEQAEGLSDRRAPSSASSPE